MDHVKRKEKGNYLKNKGPRESKNDYQNEWKKTKMNEKIA